jgi:hypothetical protein
MVIVTYDTSGNVTGYYPDSIGYNSIPSPNIEIDEATHIDAINNPGKYTVVNGVFTAAAVWPIPLTPDELKATANAPLLAQLAALDSYIPRGLEDMWTATGFDTTKLPTTQQARLAQKIAFRGQLQK